MFSGHSGGKLEINNKISRKISNVQKSSNIRVLLNYLQVQEEFTRETGKFFKLNNNEHTTYQTLWDVTKVVITRKLIALNIYIEKRKV